MKPARLKYVRAETAQHAVELLFQADSSARILAGGQSLIPALCARSVSASMLVDITQCPGLDDESESPEEVTIGAACRQSRVERSSAVRRSIPLLSEALGWVAMPQVRSRGTVVGCLAQANAGGEVPVVALALDTQLNILLNGGTHHKMAAKEAFATESGTRVPPRGVILSASFGKLTAGEGWGFHEIQLRQGHFALVCCAATLLLDQDGCIRSARIAVGGLNSNPYRAERAEKMLKGEAASRDSVIREAARVAAEECPWPARTDLHATGAFRAKAAVAVLVRSLMEARGRCSLRRPE
jgi:2-furoyl-CoA dehydrogenase FAD binding subunit